MEVILALALATAVLALLTSTVAVQLRSFQAARSAVEEAQLARALLRRMADELRAIVPDPAEGELIGTLVGTPDELQFTLRSRAAGSRERGAAPQPSLLLAPSSPPQALRIVHYRIGPKPGGLVRCERDYAPTAWAAEQGKPDAWLSTAPVVAPEVEAIEFTYCQEGSAQAQWDSSRKGRLPAAVKIKVTFRRQNQRRNYLVEETAEEQRSSAVYSITVYLPGPASGYPSPVTVPQDTEEHDTIENEK